MDKPCKEWKNATNAAGYGVMTGHQLVHRVAYKLAHQEEVLNRWIDIHHICGNRKCYEVEHLEALNLRKHRADHQKSNRKMQTHCKNGHEFTEANTGYQNSDGYKCRYCKSCARERMRRRRS